MADPALLVALASGGTAAIAVTAAASLKAWLEWLEVRRMELERGRRKPERSFAGARIELASLRERVRRLEAIADGSEP